MAIKKRVLITGISGLLGSNLAFCWKEQWDVMGTFNAHPVDLQGIQTRRVDILSAGAMRQLVSEFRPHAVIHCAAMADVDACEGNKGLAERMNVHMVTELVDALAESNAKLVFISTDGVYDGAKGNHGEEETVGPSNFYSHTKYLGELQALKCPGALVARTSFFGWNIRGKMSFAEFVVSKLSNKQRVKGFNDADSSMMYTFDLAGLLMEGIEKDLRGVYNFGSSTCMSKYDFAVSLAGELNLDASLIEPVGIDDFGYKALRAKNLGMNVDKLSESLKISVPSSQDGIKHFCGDFNRQTTGLLKGR